MHENTEQMILQGEQENCCDDDSNEYTTSCTADDGADLTCQGTTECCFSFLHSMGECNRDTLCLGSEFSLLKYQMIVYKELENQQTKQTIRTGMWI